MFCVIEIKCPGMARDGVKFFCDWVVNMEKLNEITT